MRKLLKCGVLLGVVGALALMGPKNVVMATQDVVITEDLDKASSGTCGEGINWQIVPSNGGYLLVISGTGEMKNCYNSSTTNGKPWAEYEKTITAVNIGSGITKIGAWAFANCSNLESAYLGSDVQVISGSAFYNCEKLKNINMPSSLKKIDDMAFAKCVSLEKLTLPTGCTTIGEFTFGEDAKLTVYVPSTVNSIGGAAFNGSSAVFERNACGFKSVSAAWANNWDSYAKISFTDATHQYGSEINCGNGEVEYVCSQCQDTITMQYTVTNNTAELQKVIFSGPTKLVLPSSIGGYPLNIIGASAMDAYTNKNLLELVIPNSVKELKDSAIYGCGNLNKISLGQVEKIGAGAIGCCKNLKAVTIPQTTTKIETDALGYYPAFDGNGQYIGSAKVEGFTITGYRSSAAETYAKANGFQFVDLGLATMGTCGDVKWRVYQENGGYTLEIYGNGKMSDCYDYEMDGVLYSGKPWTEYQQVVTAVKVGNGVTRIGAHAFSDLSNLVQANIGSSVTEIGYAAFARCAKLQLVNVPNGVTEIADSLFDECVSLKTVTFGSGITSIGDFAFYNCQSLENVTLPSGCTKIGRYAFYDCVKSTIKVPSSVNRIDEWALMSCHAEINRSICELKRTAQLASNWNEGGILSYTDVTHSYGSEINRGNGVVEYICSQCQDKITMQYAVENNEAILKKVIFTDATKLVLPNTINGYPLTTIATGVFDFATRDALCELVISDSVKEIQSGGIYDCKMLAKVSLGKVETLGEDAIGACPSLESITVPKTVKTFGRYAIGYIPIFEGDVFVRDEPKAGFTIYGFASSEAEKYANENGFKFVVLSSINGPVEDFVTRMYTKALGRAGEAGGIDFWVENLVNGTKTGATLADAFFMSEELKNQNISNAEYVKRCYDTFFDRSTDASELAYWTDMLDKGVSRKYVMAGFCGSDEFNKICQNYGIVQGTVPLTAYMDQNIYVAMFVTRCYSRMLGRTPEESGVEFWAEQLITKKTSAVNVSMEIAKSDEFKNKGYTDAQYVQILYAMFFDRSPASEEISYWMGLLYSGQTRNDLLNSFGNSNEFAMVLRGLGL